MYPIPANATRIRYLESTGTQYIDTGITVDNPIVSASVVFSYSSVSSGIHMIIGAYNDNGSSPRLQFYRNGSSFLADAGYATLTIDGSTTRPTIQSNVIYNGVITQKNTQSANTMPLFIFARNNNSPSQYLLDSGLQVRSCSIMKGGVLVRSYVPLRVGSVGYLFDRVSGTLFGNAGTGSFVLGPDTFAQGVLPTRMMAMGKHNSMVRLSSCWANGEVDLPVDFIPSDGVTVEDTIRSTGGYSGSSDRAIFGVSSSSQVWQNIFCRKNGSGYCFVCAGPFGEFRWSSTSTVNDGQFHIFRSGPWTTSYTTSMTEYKVDGVSRTGSWNGKRSLSMPQNRICLFACRTYNGGLTFKCSEKSHCELKRLRFEKNGVTLASYVPVRMNGIVGVYNEISKRVFFPVSGTLGGE